MKHIGKWTFPIIIVVLLVMIIDINIGWRSWPTTGALSLFATDLILGGLLVLFILLSILKNRR